MNGLAPGKSMMFRSDHTNDCLLEEVYDQTRGDLLHPSQPPFSSRCRRLGERPGGATRSRGNFAAGGQLLQAGQLESCGISCSNPPALNSRVTSFILGFSVPEKFRSQKKRPRPEQKELTNLETVMNKEGAATKD